MRPDLQSIVPFYTLEQVAEDWSCTVIDLWAMAHAGSLEVQTVTLCGQQVAVIDAGERQRIEAKYGERKSKRPTAALRRDARRSYEDVIASLLALYFGSEPVTLRPYELTKELQQLAARIGLPMPRSERKYAAILASAGALLRDCGFTDEPEQHTETLSPDAAPAPEKDAQTQAKTINAQRAA